MATLSTNQTARITALINYLDQGSAGKTIDDTVANELARIFGSSCGFKCGCPGTFLEGLRDAPYSTLLKLLVCSEGSAAAAARGADTNSLNIFSLYLKSFGVLAGTTITNTGGSVVTGDLGLSPGTSVTGFPPGTVTGAQHVTDTAAANAQLALTAEYLIAAGQTPGTVVSGNIGGQTLPPGTYTSASTLAISSGNLTLDGGGNPNAAWLFQVGSTLTTTVGLNVILAGSAQAKNIVWQVGSSATLGVSTIFKGSILALTSITVGTNANVEGRLLARNGAVTLDTNAVVVPA
jgi:hypothetical protein